VTVESRPAAHRHFSQRTAAVNHR